MKERGGGVEGKTGRENKVWEIINDNIIYGVIEKTEI